MNKLVINNKELEEYYLKVENARERLKDFDKKFLNTLAAMVMQRVIPRTPVKTGRLRRSWKVSEIKQKGNDLEIAIYNDAKDNGMDESYASYIEYGHFTRGRVDWIEGRWMLTISTDEVNAEMRRVYDNLFNKFMKEQGL
nr:MAG TPA: type I neck protein [Caudoviricetes sp.]